MDYFIKTFNAGGAVMYPLLFASILTIALGIERLYFWTKIGRREKPMIRTVLDLYQSGSPLVIERLERDRDLPIARIFMAAIGLKDPTPEEFRLAMESEAHAEIPILRRFIDIFDAIIGLAPLLGLLGTVTGLIISFDSLKIGQSVGAGSSKVVGGIAEALISTATGVIVAVMASLCANLFRALYQRQMSQIQESTGQLELIHRRNWQQ
ncbi:MotA/TolQ/ExbB proton channel family protein [Chamaesiphon polymorphus]|uniref:Biopolymer transporter ExbB n=1 Tax=Chamaesiphon polymorphus CCALA 037 TaxID=2107692 RepID=A0A2T1GDM2_9CYAN|nr:MotA/TolQ/ExbB proton channel family protein [Chamaesiphon polymorphus]PSB55600.1 biopolymer transporter ExbB [Chamaesiphon polymorphus CCALA 037]